MKIQDLLVLSGLSLLLTSPLFAAPPMGWNSWDSYGLTVTEPEFKANATVLAQKLLPHGWSYAVVDEGWYLKNPEAKPGHFEFTLDANGRYVPAPGRFSDGLKGLADWTHAQHLKFGIHIVRGIPREAVNHNSPIAGTSFHAADAADKSDACPWNGDNYGVKPNAAGQAYYDSIAALYASWGVDFLKIDCISSHPYREDEIRMVSEALRKTGRPIVLSLSPGPTPVDKATHVAEYSNMWRISDDFWDHWKQWPEKERAFSQGLLAQFKTAAQWAGKGTSGHYPDADMLPIGMLGPRPGQGKPHQSDFTHDEARTLITLWSIMQSPLILGTNLTQLDSFTESLLTNDEVLAANQHATRGRPLLNEPKRAVWVAQPDSGPGVFLAIFNLDDAPQSFAYPLQSLGVGGTSYRVRDLWNKKDQGSTDVLKVTLQPHASALYRLR
jgi:alpha-galactosidase